MYESGELKTGKMPIGGPRADGTNTVISQALEPGDGDEGIKKVWVETKTKKLSPTPTTNELCQGKNPSCDELECVKKCAGAHRGENRPASALQLS